MSDESPGKLSKIEIEQSLRQMNDEWVKALVSRDGETLERIMADDFFFAYPMEGDDRDQFIGDVVSGDVRVEFLSREKWAFEFGVTPRFSPPKTQRPGPTKVGISVVTTR